MKDIDSDFTKVRNVIDSITNFKQIDAGLKLIELFKIKYCEDNSDDFDELSYSSYVNMLNEHFSKQLDKFGIY
jgi:hypothetical protein